MPIDPSIILAQRPAPNVDVADAMGKVLSIRAMQQEAVTRDQHQQLQRAALAEDARKLKAEQDAERVASGSRAAVASGWKQGEDGSYTLDRNVVTQGLLKVPGADVTGVLGHLDEADKKAGDARKAVADADEAAQKANKLKLDVGGSIANAVKAANYAPGAYATGVHTLLLNKIITPQEANDHLAAIQQGPAVIKAITDHYIAQSDEQRKLGQSAVKEAGPNGLVNTETGAVVVPPKPEKGPNSEKATFRLDGKDVEGSYIPGVGGKTGRYISPSGEDVTARVQKVPSAAAAAAGVVPEIKLTPRQESVAADLGSGKLTFADFARLYPSRGGAGAAAKEAIYTRARELNPTFSPAQFEAGFKLATNPQVAQRVVAINSLSPVIDKITSLAAESGNTTLPLFNKLLMEAKFQLGGKTITDLRQLQTILGDEVGLALGVGSGSDLKTKLGLDLVNPTLSPANFLSTMQQLQSILGSRRDTLLKGMGAYGQGSAAVPIAAGEKKADPMGIR